MEYANAYRVALHTRCQWSWSSDHIGRLILGSSLTLCVIISLQSSAIISSMIWSCIMGICLWNRLAMTTLSSYLVTRKSWTHVVNKFLSLAPDQLKALSRFASMHLPNLNVICYRSLITLRNYHSTLTPMENKLPLQVASYYLKWLINGSWFCTSQIINSTINPWTTIQWI